MILQVFGNFFTFMAVPVSVAILILDYIAHYT